MGAGAARMALVEAGLRAACDRAARARPIGAFELFRIPVEHPFLRALALPRAEPSGWEEPLRELVGCCAAEGLVPRIELLAERRPALRATLGAAGWIRTLAVPVLVKPVDTGTASAVTEPVLRLEAASERPLLAATLEAQHAILGAAPPRPAEEEAFRACLADGSVRTWIRLDEEGRPVAAASLLGGAPAVELAGLWSRPDRRRRGLARSVARAALAAAGEGGCGLVWAGAASGASAALLGSLGMIRLATLESWERAG